MVHATIYTVIDIGEAGLVLQGDDSPNNVVYRTDLENLVLYEATVISPNQLWFMNRSGNIIKVTDPRMTTGQVFKITEVEFVEPPAG